MGCSKLEARRESEMQKLSEPCSVYRHYDSDDRLLYVGIARNPKRRRYQHACTASWGRSIARTVTVNLPTKAEALAMEERAIAFEQPIHNKRRPFRPLARIKGAVNCPLLADLFLRRGAADAEPPKPIQRDRPTELPPFDFEDWADCLSRIEIILD
jgi:predicted GIY-YIG superfamily endonuclease